MKPHMLYPDQDLLVQKNLKDHQEALIKDLGLETLLEVMAQDDLDRWHTARWVLLNSEKDVRVLRYRQAVLKDCLEQPEAFRALYSIARDAVRERRGIYLSFFSELERPSASLSSASDYLDKALDRTRELRLLAEEKGESFHSEGFRQLFAQVSDRVPETAYTEMKAHLAGLSFPRGLTANAGVGPGGPLSGYTLLKPERPAGSPFRHWFHRDRELVIHVDPRDMSGLATLTALKDQSSARAAVAIVRSARTLSRFYEQLLTELDFYMAGLALYEALVDAGAPTAFPAIRPAVDCARSYSGLYDIGLALIRGAEVVGNTLIEDGAALTVVTGANQGGKSTFLRSLGLAQLMLQCGLFVPAEAFEASLCDGIFTHFRRPEDRGMDSGKLEEELKRMNDIVSQLRPASLVLLNESFSATNESEGSEIAEQITLALLAAGVRVVFVTHFYRFSQELFDLERPDILFLRAERQDNGSRTFKIKTGAPQPVSFGMDLYRQIFKEDTSDTTERPMDNA